MASNNIINSNTVQLPIAFGGTGTNTQAGAINALVSGAALTTATVATDDKVLIQDTSAANALRTVTAQSIADLAAGGITNPVLLSGHPVLGFVDVGASAVNYIGLVNSETANPVKIAPLGSDSNIALWINAKGTSDILISANGGSITVDSTIALSSSGTISNTASLFSVNAANVWITCGSGFYTLPTSQGAARTTLINDGAGALTWGGPGVLQNGDGSPVVMPATQGGAGATLINDGSGNLSWSL